MNEENKDENYRNRKKMFEIELIDMELDYLYKSVVYKPERYRKVIDQFKSYDKLSMSKKERKIFMENLINVSEDLLDISVSVLHALERFKKLAKDGNTFMHQKYNKVLADLKEIKKFMGVKT